MTGAEGRIGPWLVAHEGWYGPPLRHEDRLDLVPWLAAHGYDGYAHAPKDDPHHRDRWREPYPPEQMAQLRALHHACADAGLELVAMVSPGLDWRGDDGDIDALVAKLAAFRDLGVGALSVNWDDVPGHGAAAGSLHGTAIAAAVERVGPDLRWLAAPVDYATAHPTPYLLAFAAELPDHVEVLWTGASVVSPVIGADEHAALVTALGRRVGIAENFPVNDLAMSDVLHLGPYPRRDPALRDAVGTVAVNFMDRPRASRVGLAVAAAFWRGDDDRERAWEAAVTEQPGLAPLARACRMWADHPGPDPVLAAWAEDAIADPDPAAGQAALRAFLDAGCRRGLDPALAAEVEPWLERWEEEAAAMREAMDVLAHRATGIREVWAAASRWARCRRPGPQVFGTRFARYPLTRRHGDELVADRGAVVHGDNLTDRLWSAATDALGP